jgi:NAD(P)-dependent dehydrogenase (short-subunit alcohol dehydrogenase family)
LLASEEPELEFVCGALGEIGHQRAQRNDFWLRTATRTSFLTMRDARAIQLDVTNQASITAAAERIRNAFGRLDVLMNNAGISHMGKPGRSLQEIVKSGRLSVASLDEVRAVFETNVFGVITVTQAMLPLLREASAARIVNVSSSSGSLTMNSDPTNPHRAMFGTYSSSKAALNAITVAFASDLESAGIKVNAACRASPRRTSTPSKARARSNRPRVSPCAWRSLTRTVRRARFRTRTACSHGDVI